MKKILLLIFILFFSQLFSQLSSEQESILKKKLTQKINSIRKQKGLHILENSKHLAESGKLQSDYNSTNNSTSKSQENELLNDTEKRVLYNSSDYDFVGENITKTKPIAAPFHSKKLIFISNFVFNSWRKSSTAMKNILSSDFSHTDFGISYNVELKQFFISNVFGKKKHKIPNQLSEFAFGIKDNAESVSDFSQNEILAFNEISNNIVIENDEVFLYINNNSITTKLLQLDNDGFAVDLISKKQIKCGVVNKLDISPIYDGVLLKPVYKEKILGSIYSGKVSLGKIPESIKIEELRANIIVLKNNTKYHYITTNTLSDNKYDIQLPVKVEFEKPNIDLQNQGIYIAKEIFFDFETSKSITDKYTEAKFDLNNVHSFSIKSYTSVDGSENANTILQNKRADFIKKHIGTVLGFSLDHVKIRIDARENWKLYNYQLKLYGHNNMLSTSKSQKRLYANNTLKNSWDKQFNEQRKSKIIAFQHGYWNRNNKQNGFYNLLNGLITDDVHLVNKSLLWLYGKEVNYELNKDYILDRLLTNKELVQNVAAIFQKHIKEYDLSYIVYFLDNWIYKSESLSAEAQKNLLYLYSTTTLEIVKKWNEDNKNLARIIDPKNVEQLFKVYKATTPTNSLFINYHIAKISYYNKINNKEKIKESFDFIISNYNTYSTNIDDKVKLAQFFNNWKKHSYALNILLKAYESNKLNPEGILLLAKTINLTPSKLSQKEIQTINQKALIHNKEGWCKWMNENFQLFTNNSIKDSFCSKCN